MYVPTTEDVAAALRRDHDRPQNVTDVSSWIAAARGIAWRIDQPVISRNQVERILAEMVESGGVVRQRGSQWKDQGITFHDQRDVGWYYGLSSDVPRWLEAAAAKAAARALDAFREQALLVLRDRHPGEYEQIVADMVARARAARP